MAAGWESSANKFESGAGELETLCFERGTFSVGNVCRGGRVWLRLLVLGGLPPGEARERGSVRAKRVS